VSAVEAIVEKDLEVGEKTEVRGRKVFARGVILDVDEV